MTIRGHLWYYGGHSRTSLPILSNIDVNYIFFNYSQVDSEEERLPDEKYVNDLSKTLPQGTDKTPEVLEEALKGLPDK